MPTLNKKLFFRLLALCVLLGGGVFLLHYFQASRAADALLWQAEHHAQDGKLDKAINFMRQYLELRPDDNESIVRLCELIEERDHGPQDASKLLFLYEKVLRNEPDRESARRRAIELSLVLGRHQDALAHLEVLMSKHAEDGKLWQQFGRCQLAKNEYESAADALEKSIEFAPQDVVTYELLAALQVQHLKLPAEAKSTLDRGVTANPENPDAFLVRARFHRSVDDRAACEQDLDRLLLLDPENVDGVLMMAELSQQRGDVHAARMTLTQALELHRRDLRLYRSLSWLELSAGNRPAAVACLERGIKELPNETELLTPLADLLVQDGNFDRVREIIAKLDARKAMPSQIRYLRARLAMGEKDWTAAIERLEALRGEAVSLPGLDAQVNLLLAVCYHERANTEAELVALTRALTVDPANLSARISVGNLHLNNGRFLEAKQEYEIVTKSPYAPFDARIMLGRLLLAEAKQSPSTSTFDRVNAYLSELQQAYPDATEPVTMQADVLSAQGRHDEAITLLRQGCARQPGDAGLWNRLASEEYIASGSDAAFEVLDEAQAIAGDRVELRLARARLWAESVSPARAERVREAERHLDRLADADQLRVLYGLVDLYAGLDHQPGLKRVYLAIAERLPEETLTRLELLDIALAEGDHSSVKRLQAELQARISEDPTAMLTAQVYEAVALDKPTNRLRERLEDSLAREPGRAELWSALARIAQHQGDEPLAGQYLAKAYQLDRARLSRLRALVTFHAQGGRLDDAQTWLFEAHRDPRISVDQFENLFASATTPLSDPTFQQCVGWIEPFVESDANRQLWLGDLLRRRGLTQEAQARYRAAVTLAPERTDAYLHLAHLAALTADVPAIDRLMAEAKAAIPMAAYQVLCAQTAVLVGEMGKGTWRPKFASPDDRREYAQAALRVLLGRDRHQEALAILEQIANEPNGRPEDVAWAKRNLALLKAVHGTPEERQEAVRYLQESRGTATGPEDHRAQAAILAVAYRHADGEQRAEVLRAAIDAMKVVVETPEKATRGDLLQLAHLYREAGDRPAYRRCLRALVNENPKNPSFITTYVDACLDDGEWADAAEGVDRLQRDFATDFRAIRVMAKYYHLTDAPDKAIELIEQYVRAVPAGSSEAPQRVWRAAETLDELSMLQVAQHPASAGKLAQTALRHYEACLSGQPDAVVSLAALLTRLGEAELAYDHLLRQKPRLSPRSLAAGGLSLVRSGRATPRQIQTVQQWLDEGVAKQPNSVALKLSLAEFHTLRGQFAQAEAAYLNVLSVDPENVIALNNLAWIMAPNSGKASQALTYIDRAIGVAGRTGELLDTRARVHIAGGNYDQAVRDLNEALTDDATSLRYFHLAVAKLKQNRSAEAVDAFRQATAQGLTEHQVHPEDLPAYRALMTQVGG